MLGQSAQGLQVTSFMLCLDSVQLLHTGHSSWDTRKPLQRVLPFPSDGLSEAGCSATQRTPTHSAPGSPATGWHSRPVGPVEQQGEGQTPATDPSSTTDPI